MKMEIFSCSGGLAKGFADEGIEFDLVVDKDKNAVESYAHNLGHRPVQMDAEDLLRMVYLGWRPAERVHLLVADPPCTPWSRAGARKGMADKRDQLRTTVELIRLLQPYCFLVANVPGLDDLPNLKHVHATIGSLRDYLVQYVSLDAASYGVPQHRHRPFWFGRPAGTPELRWPSPTHGADVRNLSIPGCELQPYVTCRQALAHLSLKELGKPIRMRMRRCNGKQHSSVPDRPARVVGTSNLSDGNVLAPAPRVSRARRANHKPSDPDRPARTITGNTHSDGALLERDRHPISYLDAPARVVSSSQPGNGGAVLEMDPRAIQVDPSGILLANGKHPVNELDKPSFTVTTKGDMRGAQGACVLAIEQGLGEWPWDRPATTVTAGDRLAPPGHHGSSFLSAKDLDQPSLTVTRKDRVGTPGRNGRRHPQSWNAIKLSERAGAILQGFPETWKFLGKTKEERWSMIGQAMPPGLARPVAHSVRVWLDARLAQGALTAWLPPAAPALPPARAAAAASAPATLPLVLEPLNADSTNEDCAATA